MDVYTKILKDPACMINTFADDPTIFVFHLNVLTVNEKWYPLCDKVIK